MIRSIQAQEVQPGMVLALPFGRSATIESVKVGRQFVHLRYVEDYPPGRVSIGDEVLIQLPDHRMLGYEERPLERRPAKVTDYFEAWRLCFLAHVDFMHSYVDEGLADPPGENQLEIIRPYGSMEVAVTQPDDRTWYSVEDQCSFHWSGWISASDAIEGYEIVEMLPGEFGEADNEEPMFEVVDQLVYDQETDTLRRPGEVRE